ncbi:hypothetical protein CHU_1234 [Cytophaga hutchinsonii ATCC 33406]|uniref:Uncharacterized protein n=1 Tax=Cytophaga hutchinsonii (strain ATCC 33406 / DSM 1761 / CIP 103989 / NBRC 15051 / NCIMB 9469 / D465) TaxID=269798 RepID=A0A6N4SQD8_CYTH3|nr:hypothetical protein CHU_1234 [Cytophaga hutchinsonii ATCC 33406]SFX75902.1 hypothetical protein SAMN04487930_10974 [Cytophaga hutchinsonii ATCC 33406]
MSYAKAIRNAYATSISLLCMPPYFKQILYLYLNYISFFLKIVLSKEFISQVNIVIFLSM